MNIQVATGCTMAAPLPRSPPVTNPLIHPPDLGGSRVYGNTLATLFTHCVDSGTFSSRTRVVRCALAWVTIARDSESEYPISCGAIPQD